MSNEGSKLCLVCLALIIAPLAVAQDQLTKLFTLGAGNVAEIKQAAENGDIKAQVRLAGLLAAAFRSAEALEWYRKAASKGSLEAAYHVGHMLLFGAMGINPKQGVEPEPTEGIAWIFITATHGYIAAYHDMSKAYQQGLGVSADPILAYAWLQLCTDSSISPLAIAGRVELNQMALNLDTRSIQRAQVLAANFKAGNWQKPVIVRPPQEPTVIKENSIPTANTSPAAKPPKVLAPLKLSAIATSSGGNASCAVINGKILAQGESANIPTQSGTLTVKCLKIEPRSIQVMVEGEDGPRTLSFN
jgi:hypothetical protein